VPALTTKHASEAPLKESYSFPPAASEASLQGK